MESQHTTFSFMLVLSIQAYLIMNYQQSSYALFLYHAYRNTVLVLGGCRLLRRHVICISVYSRGAMGNVNTCGLVTVVRGQYVLRYKYSVQNKITSLYTLSQQLILYLTHCSESLSRYHIYNTNIIASQNVILSLKEDIVIMIII